MTYFPKPPQTTTTPIFTHLQTSPSPALASRGAPPPPPRYHSLSGRLAITAQQQLAAQKTQDEQQGGSRRTLRSIFWRLMVSRYSAHFATREGILEFWWWLRSYAELMALPPQVFPIQIGSELFRLR
jgi:hypothetical protein